MLQPMVEKVKSHKMAKGKTIVVADKGLNSVPNINYLCNQGDGYLFSQVLRGKKGVRYHHRLFDESLYTVNKDGTYKWQLFEEEFSGRDKDGKKTTRKRKVLIYWDAADAKVARKKREEKIKRAEKSLNNKAYTLDHSKQKYIKAEVADTKTGEILHETVDLLSIDQEKIDEDAKFDGYFCLITSELDYDEKKMRAVYHTLWMIENTFRTEKTDLEMRPVYVSTDDHIRAHFMIGHLATLITRLIQFSIGKLEISPERIQRVLQSCILDVPSSGIVHIHEISGKLEFESIRNDKGVLAYSTQETGEDEVYQDFKLAGKAINLSLEKAYIRKEEFVRRIQKVAIPLQKSRHA